MLVRLVPGSQSGRVEVLHNDIWGTVCIVSFDHNEANVLCKMMGFKYSTTTRTGNPGKKLRQEVPSCPVRRGLTAVCLQERGRSGCLTCGAKEKRRTSSAAHRPRLALTTVLTARTSLFTASKASNRHPVALQRLRHR